MGWWKSGIQNGKGQWLEPDGTVEVDGYFENGKMKHDSILEVKEDGEQEIIPLEGYFS